MGLGLFRTRFLVVETKRNKRKEKTGSAFLSETTRNAAFELLFEEKRNKISLRLGHFVIGTMENLETPFSATYRTLNEINKTTFYIRFVNGKSL